MSFRRIILLIPLAIVFMTAAPYVRTARSDPKTKRPKLVLVIIVDQMRADYLDRFYDLFCEKGIRHLLKNGARFTNCNYDYTPTNTAPGHSFILSGIYPGTSGIISNEWYSVALGRIFYCVEDSNVSSLGIDSANAAGKMSPRNFHGISVGDRLKAVSPESKVIGISIKDRGAILPAGKHASGAFWFDPQSGRWISSNYYFHRLPDWVQSFNDLRQPESYLRTIWNRLLPAQAYARQGLDSARGEGLLPGENSPVFPHIVADISKPASIQTSGINPRRFDALLPTPAGDELTIQFAEAALAGEQLGQRNVTDILSISFSSLDYCGHIFGPDSHEIEDMVVCLDRSLAGLFAYIDSSVGLQNTFIALTADHGVCPLPERKSASECGRINSKDMLMTLKVRIGQQFNYNEGNENLITALSNDYIYLDYPGIHAHGWNADSFEVAVGNACMKERYMARFYTRTQLEHSITGGGLHDSIQMKIEKGFNKELSGGVALVVQPYSFFSGLSTGTTHGAPNAYDTHVPLVLFGEGVRRGKYSYPVSPSIISATLSDLLGISVPSNSSGVAWHGIIR
jgi:predicted AlkP superfamily pyrophosphatase or phosphodiesterase